MNIIDYIHDKQFLSGGTRIVLTTIHTLRRNVATLSTYQFDYLIVDEAHEVRNPKTLAYNALLKIQAKNRFMLSGTPAINGKRDIIALAGLLKIDPYTDMAWWKSADEDAIDEWYAKYFYHIDKNKVLNLPQKTERTVLFELDEIQKAHYKEVEDTEHVNKLVHLLRLRQATLLNVQEHVSQKYRVLRELIEDITPEDSILVFCSFRQAIEEVEIYLKETLDRPVIMFHGQMTGEQRKEQIRRFDQETASVNISNSIR